MSRILQYLRQYLLELNWFVAVPCMLMLAAAVSCNYYFGLNDRIGQLAVTEAWSCWFLIFLVLFGGAYLVLSFHKKPERLQKFYLLLVLAPALFAWKMSAAFCVTVSNSDLTNDYWTRVLQWPMKLAVIAATLYFIQRFTAKEDRGFFGFAGSPPVLKPYFLMLAAMLPLIAIASTQTDFLHIYPRLLHVAYFEQHPNAYGHALLYELSYGLDFISIELFFRGFLVVAFARWWGKDAILPMAMFYCAIHFGKPLGECISSFFGGTLLGVISYNTRSITGGLIVHLGIAWMMEAGGYVGSHLFL